jgi:transcriptional regulator with XRE-family HTH domain
MTLGEFLTFCQKRAGIETKSEFARKLGMKDADHLTGAMNDKERKRPSLDVLERAAELAGLKLEDCLVIPETHQTEVSRKHARIHRQLQYLLDLGGEAGEWIAGNIITYYKAYFRRR